MAKSNAQWKGGMAFDIDLQNHTIPVDAVEQFGGRGYGPQPKGLMLSALAGCTAMDVTSLLDKMKVPFEAFTVDVSGEMADQHPKVYTRATIRYEFSADTTSFAEKKVLRAIDLSLNSYCGIAATMKHSTEISYELVLNGSVIASGKQGDET